MIWRLVIRSLKCRKHNYVKYIKLGKDVFIVKIYRYISIEEMLKTAANNGVLAAMESKERGE